MLGPVARRSHYDYNGHLSVIVSSKTSTPDRGTLLISGSIDQIDLAEVQGDALSQLGRFEDIEQLVTELVRKCS